MALPSSLFLGMTLSNHRSSNKCNIVQRTLDVILMPFITDIERVWRYQRGNQNPYIEKEQTTLWPKENVQKGKQRSTKHKHKTKDRLTRTPLVVSSSCSTSFMTPILNAVFALFISFKCFALTYNKRRWMHV